MRALLLILIASSALGQGRFDRFNQRTDQGRSTRGFEQSSYAFFEFAPASGAGMGTACACTTPTGAKGEALTFTRAGDATCSKQGLATTGIANGDLVVCTVNQPRVESSGGVLGLRVEGARTNVLPRFINPCDAAWADVGTPALTGQVVSGTACATTTPQASPWSGTYANAAVQFDDNDGAAFEGRTQTVTVSAATAYTMSCFVKAGTLASATVSLDGTTANITGLSSTTWSILSVTDASSSGVAIAAQVLNGSTAAATGTVVWGGCQVEAGAHFTSMIPTVAGAATRNADDAYIDLPPATLGDFSVAGTAWTPSTAAVRRLHGAFTKAPDDGSNFVATYQDTGTLFGQFVSGAGSSTWNTALATATTVRAASFISGGTVGACINGTCATQAIGTFNPALITHPRRLRIGAYATTNGNIDGVATLVCFQPDSPTRCR